MTLRLERSKGEKTSEDRSGGRVVRERERAVRKRERENGEKERERER